MTAALEVIGGLTLGLLAIWLLTLAWRLLMTRLRRTWFAGKTCSRNIARIMARHEDRHVRVIQLGKRVSMLVDLNKATEAQCDCPRRIEVADWVKEGRPRP